LGASIALIASQRWPSTTLHVNIMAEQTREGNLDVLAGAIFEGPFGWTVRPVGEVWLAHAGDGGSHRRYLPARFGAFAKACPSTARSVLSPCQTAPHSSFGLTLGV
jgi:hypothetical protein